MFLVTTAEESTWDLSEKIVFLGEWCCRHSRREVWSALDYIIHPYHWEDKEKFYSDVEYINVLYEKYLKVLSNKLNDYHGVDYDLRYWRILIGPWLFLFVGVIFDRYEVLKTLLKAELIKKTKVLDIRHDSVSAIDMDEFLKFVTLDYWNHHIYSYILKKLTNDVEYVKTSSGLYNNENSISHPQRLKRFIIEVLRITNKIIPYKLNKNIFSGHHVSNKIIFKIKLKLKELPIPLIFIKPNKFSPTYEQLPRSRLKLNSAESEFEILLEDLIIQQIPRLYLEGYSAIKNHIMKKHLRNVKKIITAISHLSNDYFKVWAAELIALKNSELIIMQHGGNYGSARFNQMEEHELSIADVYWSWGWKRSGFDNIKYMPSLKLQSSKKNIYKRKLARKILFIFSSPPRYSYYCYSSPISSQQKKCIYQQIELLKMLDSEIIRDVKLRLYPIDYGWDTKHFMSYHGLGDLCYSSNDSIYTQIRNSRLCVVTYNATAFLETFSANFPTILFFNDFFWGLRKNVETLFSELERVGIMHTTASSLAQHLTKINANVDQWWFSDEVQSAKNALLAKLGYTSDDFLRIYSCALK